MAELLISVRDETTSEHGWRSWLAASALQECSPVRIVSGGDEWDPKDIWAGLVFNSPGDGRHLARLRAAGRPSLYHLWLGPLDQGRILEPVLHEPWHRMDTRLKMQAATAVLVDSFAQAAAAQDHYALTPAWAVLRPAPDGQYRNADGLRPNRAAFARLLVVGDMDSAVESAVEHWCVENGIKPERYTREVEILQALHASHEEGIIVLWLYRSSYGERILSACASGVPLVAMATGVVDPTSALAEWIKDAEPETVVQALSRAAKWENGNLRAQIGAATGYDWTGWATQLLAGLRRLALSPAAQYLLPNQGG